MTLFINDEEAQQVLDMRTCIEAMATVFAEEARGRAVNHPRQRYTLPRHPKENESAYWTNLVGGAAPSTGLAALRVNSRLVREFRIDNKLRMDFEYPDRRAWGFVILFSIDSGRPVAIYNDFWLSPMRVAATTALAVRALANRDATHLGLFGTGKQGATHLEAISLVRDIELVKVFSPNERHRANFVERMQEKVPAHVLEVDRPHEVVANSDIIMCATNSSRPVFDGSWLTPGQMVCTLVNTDHNTQRTEADRTTFVRSDIIVVNSLGTARGNNQVELWEPIEAGDVSLDSVVELGQVVADPSMTPELYAGKIVYYKSNAGVGIQFAAAGAVIFKQCLDRGLGTEVPTELFGTRVSG